jgi:small-conductance mechanosensitive channel/CRP-like cAMP-binding protein
MSRKHSDLIVLTLFMASLVYLLFESEPVLQWITTTKINQIIKDSLEHFIINQLPIVSWFLGTFLLIRYSSLLFWQLYFPNKTKTPTPKIIIDIYTLIIWFISLSIALSYFFDKDITGLVTASGLVVGVLGFSLRTMIADFFYGIAITLEQPYRVGDWIEINSGGSIKIGKVKQIAWRSTLIITGNNIHVTVPHSVIATSSFNNYSYPDPLWCSSFQIILSSDITTQEAERIFFAAIKQIEELASIPKEPSLSIVRFLTHGIEWRISFWVRDYPMESIMRLKIQRNVLRDLSYFGIELTGERLEILAEKTNNQYMVAKGRNNWARHLDLFDCLTEKECEKISQQAIRSIVPKGNILFEQGSEGSSLFLIYQGLLDVFVKNKTGVNERVNQLRVGDVFGEMSLLTGDPRNATVIPVVDTVVYEINKSMVEPYLRDYPLLLEHIEKLLAERKLQTMQFLKKINNQSEAEITRDNALMEMQQKIRRFFNLS